MEIDDLYPYLCTMISGEMEPIRTIKTDWGEMDLRRNPDIKPQEEVSDDFIIWPYYLDIEPKAGVDESEYIGQIGRLLKALKQKDIKAVAACDFEEKVCP